VILLKAKKVIVSLTIACALLIPVTVFAATSDTPVAKSVRGFFGINMANLNDQQKADVKTYSQKMADVQKEFINKMVSNGAMTKEQGDAAIAKIDEALKNGETIPMFGGMGKGHEGFGDKGMFGIDTSKLTDAQKSDFAAIYAKMADAQKAYLKKEVASGLITQAQADTMTTKIDKSIKNNECPEFGFGMNGMMGKRGPNSKQSSLTDQQKADLQDYQTTMKELQKELINKAVSDGVITKEQGEKELSMIDNPQSFERGMKDGRGGMRGGMKGGRMGRDFDQNNSVTTGSAVQQQ
jgi:hypothetical protein